MIDKMTGDSPPQGAPVSADKDGGRRDKSAEGRIAELTRQRNQANQAFQSLQDDFNRFREEFSEFRGRVSAGVSGNGKNGPISSYSDIPDHEIPDAFRSALNPEQMNPDALYNTVNEMVARKLEGEKEKWLQETKGQREHERYAQGVEAKILQDFPEAQDTSSPLFERAAVYMQEMQNQFGQNVFKSQPDRLHHAFSMARNDLLAGQSKETDEWRARAERARS